MFGKFVGLVDAMRSERRVARDVGGGENGSGCGCGAGRGVGDPVCAILEGTLILVVYAGSGGSRGKFEGRGIRKGIRKGGQFEMEGGILYSMTGHVDGFEHCGGSTLGYLR